MIVECPYCATRYRVDAARLTGATPQLKCSRCTRVFPAPSSKKRSPPAAPPKPPAAAPENLTLPFDEPGWKDEAEPLPADDFGECEAEATFTLGTEDESTPPPGPRPAPEPDFESAAARTAPDDDDEADVARDDDAAHPARERGKVRALFIFLGFMVAVYAALTRALFASPALCDRLLSRVPLIEALGDERLMVRKVAFSEVVGSYQRIKDGKDVFVITGKVLNTAPVALHGVQIVGKLFDRNGRALDEKTIYCGNVISAKVLKDLTPRELSILQKLNPPKRFMIEPGGSSTFVIVFMDPPREAAEFSAQVVAAQRQA